MARRRKSGGQPPDARPAPAAPPPPATPAKERLLATLRAIAFGKATGFVLGWGMRLYAALFLGAAAVALTIGWKQGLERVHHAREFASFTGTADGRIVESWVAVEFDPGRVGPAGFWRASTRASACSVVEYEGEWGAGRRRAFCGKRLPFNDSYVLHDLAEMSEGVPFDWPREPNGFFVPQVRFPADSLAWLGRTTQPDAERGPPEPATMRGVLDRDLDRPDDVAIESWGAAPRAFPLSFDPSKPEGALPKGYVDARREAGTGWVVALVPLVIGVLLWYVGMAFVLPAMHPAGRAFFTLLPLVALPWWGDALPRNLARIQPDVAEVIADMLDTVDRVERLVASEPDEATLAEGEAVRYPVGGGAYAPTLGRIRFERPAKPPADADEAVATLAATVAAQVRALPAGEREALFAKLRQDKKDRYTGAGLLFLAAARESVLDEREAPSVRRAAEAFLADWVTQPVDDPVPSDAGFRGRLALYERLAEVPVNSVRIQAGWILERSRERAAKPGGVVR